LNNDVDVNYLDRTVDLPINLAIKAKHWNIVEYLLTQTIQPCLLNSTDKKTLPHPPLNLAVITGKYLLNYFTWRQAKVFDSLDSIMTF
jgi:hypothetical protein